MKIVQQRVKPYEGIHWSIYIDQVYISIELIKELTKKNLYVTRIVMANRLSKEVQSPKASKLLERGQYVHHRCYCKDETHKKQ